jgi:hypothetical protein
VQLLLSQLTPSPPCSVTATSTRKRKKQGARETEAGGSVVGGFVQQHETTLPRHMVIIARMTYHRVLRARDEVAPPARQHGALDSPAQGNQHTPISIGMVLGCCHSKKLRARRLRLLLPS